MKYSYFKYFNTNYHTYYINILFRRQNVLYLVKILNNIIYIYIIFAFFIYLPVNYKSFNYSFNNCIFFTGFINLFCIIEDKKQWWKELNDGGPTGGKNKEHAIDSIDHKCTFYSVSWNHRQK